MGEVSHERELGLLKKLFSVHRNAEVELTVFRNTAEAPKRISIKDGNIEPLIKALSSVVYDGGTQLGSLNAMPSGFKPDIYLLFSDGLGNFGIDFAAKLTAPMYSASADSRANHGLLRLISGETGGSYLNLAAMTNDDAVSAIGSPILRLMEVRFTPGEIEAVYPMPGSEVTPGMFSVSGRLLAQKADMTLVYGVNGREVSRKSYSLSASAAAEGNLIETFWAVQKLEALSILPKNNHEEIIAIAKQYGLTTSDTSLIVLETLNQYVEHKILPPSSLPEMRRQYAERLNNSAKEMQAGRQQKIDRIAGLWAKRVAWWEKEFTYPKDLDYLKKAKISAEADTEMPRPLLAPAAESPRPSPRPATRNAPQDMAMRSRPDDGYGAGSPGRMEERASTPPQEMAKSLVVTPRKAEATGAAAGAQITIKPWDPDTPYMKLLKQANKGDRYKVYLEQKKVFGRSPGYYFDCAEFFLTNDSRDLAIRILSNLAELELENAALLRVLAHRLSQIDELDFSIGMFEQVLKLRPEDAQSHRDLALVLARRAQRDMPLSAEKWHTQVKSDLGRAIELLYMVVEKEWKRTDEIELVALMELNRLIPIARDMGITMPAIDKRLVKALDLDLRIVLTWDMDMTDLDLWVTEPSKEKAMYSHPDTIIGGHLSHDVTGGYGPEEYSLKKGMNGEYRIDANFYGNRNPGLAGIATLQVEVFTNFGRKDEKRQVITKRLDTVKDVVQIGSVVLGR